MTVFSDITYRGFSLEDPTVPISKGLTVLDLFGGQPSSSGKRVTNATAIRATPFWNGVILSAGWMGSMPLKLYQRRSDGRGKDPVTQHPAAEIVDVRPNARMPAVSWKEAAQGHLLTRGNHYAELVFNRVGELQELWPLAPDSTNWVLDQRGFRYETTANGRKLTLQPDKVLHIRGPSPDALTGWSVVKLFREGIGLAQAMEEYGGRFYNNSSTPRGVLTTDDTLSPEAEETLKARWEAAQGGLENAHRVAVLEAGLKFQAIGLTAEDAQFIGSRRFQVEEFARMLNLPPSKLKDTSRSTFNNIEQENLSSVIDHVQGWATRWEDTCTLSLLNDAERARGLFFEYQLQGLLRGDVSSRGQFYQTQFQTASITPNEIRSLENRNPVDGGDSPYLQMQYIPLDQTGEITPTERALFGAIATGDPDAIRAVAELRKLELAGPQPEVAQLPAPPEDRQIRARHDLRRAFDELLREAAGRMVGAEIRDLLKRVGKLFAEGTLDDWLAFLSDYYDRDGPMQRIINATLAAPFLAFARAVFDAVADEVGHDTLGRDEFADRYLASFTDRYSRSSRRQLEALARDADDGDWRTPTEDRLDDWTTGGQGAPRPERVARRELVQLGEAAAKAAFISAGVLLLRWVAVGDTCPMCSALDGRVVGVRDTFVEQGQTLVGTDGTTKITSKGPIGHPPLHDGCDCLIVVG